MDILSIQSSESDCGRIVNVRLDWTMADFWCASLGEVYDSSYVGNVIARCLPLALYGDHTIVALHCI